MKTGALIFAHNNDCIDYVSMAKWSADNIERHLDIPTKIITDSKHSQHQNSRYFSDFQTHVAWHNASRTDAYELSPWDRTLVLDADYVVASDQLKILLHSDQDFLAHRWAHDITGLNDFSGLNYFGLYNMPQWWATVMIFKKSLHARLIFDTMDMIKKNWNHYKKLYNIRSPSYRNDHALSIALCVVNGHTLNHAEIPWSLASLLPDHTLSRVDQDHYRVDYVDGHNKNKYIMLKNQDFHAMGKKDLGALIANHT